ncbi:MAG TPA: LLM class flavin-dependent oxidoreductase [Methylomirabilota bacterium]|nr:LLM class flavin-dependent oxidoreductase [Methylomirabilota bacterium]
MSAPRVAISLMPLENRRETLVATALAAERRGFDAFLLPETWAYDTPIVLGEIALKTERVTLGTGIVGVWSRSAGTLAMAAATLAEMSGGRFVLGLGASTPQLTEGLHDVPFEAPVARLRRTLTQVRALLAGERIPLGVTAAARPLKLNVPAGPPVPIYLAALGDASIRVAGELADGWMPFLYPRRCLAEGVARLREGAVRGGHPDRLPAVCPSMPTVVAEREEDARKGAAWFLSFYVVSMGTLYRASLVRQGFGKEVEAVLAANTPKFAGAVPPDADALLEELIVFGTPPQARARLARWHAAGAALPTLLLPPNLTAAQLEFTLDALRPPTRA